MDVYGDAIYVRRLDPAEAVESISFGEFSLRLRWLNGLVGDKFRTRMSRVITKNENLPRDQM